MPQAGSQALRKVMDMLQAEESLSSAIGSIAQEAGLELPAIAPAQIRALNAAPELVERGAGTRFPCVHVYCERVSNLLREKYRRFSGKVRMAVEIRNSLDRLDGLEDQVRYYADAIGQVLDRNRGDWGDGVFYPGGYEVTFGPVKQGGKNFLQTAKATFDLEISY
jgi:hypothetical protein